MDDLHEHWAAGRAVGLATVVETWRSAPRPPGAAMLVTASGDALGSVSGGCVEGAVYELAYAAATDPDFVPVLERYGVSDDDAFAVGLTCGGTIHVYVERVSPETFPQLGGVVADIRAGVPVAVATCVDPADAARFGRRLVVRADSTEGTFGSARLDEAVTDDARGMLVSGTTGTLRYGRDGERLAGDLTLAVQSYAPRPRMIVFGAIDFAAALARAGVFLGFHVTVCDARPVFATRRRFPDADAVVVEWPHRYLAAEAEAGRIDGRTVLAVLTHDAKFDVPLLEVALKLPVAYVGAMGSRRTHDDRMARLRETSLTEADLARLHSPIGLDLGARTPEETAISITAEIIAARWAGTTAPLTGSRGPIHHLEGGGGLFDGGVAFDEFEGLAGGRALGEEGGDDRGDVFAGDGATAGGGGEGDAALGGVVGEDAGAQDRPGEVAGAQVGFGGGLGLDVGGPDRVLGRVWLAVGAHRGDLHEPVDARALGRGRAQDRRVLVDRALARRAAAGARARGEDQGVEAGERVGQLPDGRPLQVEHKAGLSGGLEVGEVVGVADEADG